MHTASMAPPIIWNLCNKSPPGGRPVFSTGPSNNFLEVTSLVLRGYLNKTFCSKVAAYWSPPLLSQLGEIYDDTFLINPHDPLPCFDKQGPTYCFKKKNVNWSPWWAPDCYVLLRLISSWTTYHQWSVRIHFVCLFDHCKNSPWKKFRPLHWK